ncbi:hypothetical protein EDI_196390 [Entamoeba dispar SAW760]|uniref:Uncharacterized protein n=1 Tax=Entamoeba dispar (strain ATCC PRA-260 / SAW760) TaxID=370354 RepID=B0EL33_ENTDS|nr:uncharacterized protein EDI_196390 [Entamoeba dispar SAW760]EDR24795.1 hypothetical protein EDI_196390 [Entamoeba dispar SAW760]|eukprot:EDR24795.1 hypothetical protein EDI_196390 [Entamoeba dispar SAW760]
MQQLLTFENERKCIDVKRCVAKVSQSSSDVVSGSQDLIKSDYQKLINFAKEKENEMKEKKLKNTCSPQRRIAKLTQSNLKLKNLMGVTRSMLNHRIDLWKQEANKDAFIPYPFVM